MITTTTTITHAKGNVYCQLGEEAVILNLRDDAYYGLDPVGTAIWSKIDQPIQVEALLAALLEEYNVERAACEQELLALLNELHAKGLIEARDQPEDAV